MNAPFVSCICVTQNRRFFLRQAIAYFWRARLYYDFTHQGKAELVIVDGSERNNSDVVERALSLNQERIGGFLHDCVHYHHIPSPAHSRTGFFHNEAVERSKGDIIIQWDDDDWHDSHRISTYVRAMQDYPKGVLAYTSAFYWYHIQEQVGCKSRSWYTGGGSVGAMLAYHRSVWELIPFRDVPQGEDNFFWQDHKQAGTEFFDTHDSTSCIYMRHNRNGSPLINFVSANDDTKEVLKLLDNAGDIDFYDELAEILPCDNWNRTSPMTSPYGHRGGPWAPWMNRGKSHERK